MARDYASSSNIIYNPVESAKKRHSSGRDYRSSVSGSGTRDYRTATVKQTEAKKTEAKQPEVEQAFPMLPNLGQSITSMNKKAQVGAPTLKLGIVAPQTNPFAAQKIEQNASTNQLLPTAPGVRTYGNVERDAEPFSNLREIPIAGAVYRGLDRLQEFTEPAAEIAQEYYTPGAGFAPIAGFTGAVGSAISKVAPKLGLGEGLGKAVAREAIKEGAAGAVLGAGQSLAAHPEEGFKGAGTGAAFGGVLGGATGAASPLLGKAIKGIIERWKPAKPIEVPPTQPTQPTLRLPLGRLDAAGKRPTPGEGVITPEYTFRLGAGNDMAPKIHEARNDLKAIDSELRGINQQYEKAIVDEFQYLKQSMAERGGVTQGNIITDNMGNVIDRYGRQSNNPKWYQNFFAENGRKPSNKELYQLAKERVDNGFSDEMGDVPSWKSENGYDETVAALTDVRNTIYKTIGESENTFQVTDAPLKANELSFKPKTIIEPEAPQAPWVAQQAKETATTTPRRVEYVPDEPMTVAASPEPKPRSTGNTPDQPELINKGVRANYVNQLDNGNFSPELQQKIRNTDQRYDQQTNVASVNEANARLKDLGRAEAQFHGNTEGGAEHVATGYRLMQELDKLGEHERALNIANKLAADLTKAGQTSQAAYIISRLSPEGQLLRLVRQAERSGKKVAVEDSAKFKELAGEVQENAGAGVRENRLNDILDKIEGGGTATPDELKYIGDYLSRAKKVIGEKEPVPEVRDFNLEDVFPEMKNPRKREKVISFLDKQEQAALERIKARKNRLNALPFDEWADHAIVVASQIGKGAIKASTHVEDLVKLFGEEIRPVATKVYQKAQTIVKGVARSSAEGKLDEAKKAMNRVTGKDKIDTAVIEEMANQVKMVIDNAKKGKVEAKELQKMRDYADEIAEMLGDGPPPKFPTAKDKYFQTVKSLSKKMADVEKKSAPPSTMDQKEIEGLLRQISNLKEGSKIKAKIEIDTKALSDVAHDVLKKPRPIPKVRKTPTKEVRAANAKLVNNLANNVKKVIAEAKLGKFDAAALEMIRKNSAAVAKTTSPARLITPEQKFLQSVKSLAKKVAKVETKKAPTTQLNREVEGLVRHLTKLQEAGKAKPAQAKVNNNAISNIAHDLLNKTRPTPKPTTLQEKIVEKYIKQNGQVSASDIKKLRELAKEVTKLSGNKKTEADIAMQRILNSYEKSSAWDKITALRYIGMLLNTSTQLVNAGSGPIMASTGYLSDIFGTMMDVAISKVFKTPRTTTLYAANPLDFMVNYMNSLKTGMKAGWHGANPAGIQGTGEIRGLAFKSLKNPLTVIPSLLERSLGAVAKGTDYAAYRAINQGELVKQGYLDAINKGIKGRENIKSHVKKFVNEPPEIAVDQADKIARNATFQRSDSMGGKAANWLNSTPPWLKPITSGIFPFVRTPVNIASTAVKMTPVGVLKGLYQLTSKSPASQREAIRTLGLSLVGTGGLSTIGYELNKLGIITGANDSGNKDVDAVREQAGRGKYRFNQTALVRYLKALVNGDGKEAASKAAKFQEGDKQFDYNKFQPLALPLAIGAGVNEAKQQGKGLLGQAQKAGTDAYGSLYGMSTLKGLQDVFQPSYDGSIGEKALGMPKRIIESFLKSFSPSFLAQEARRQDELQRKTPYNDGLVKDVTDYYKSRTPGLSQTLPASRTTLGTAKKNAPGIQGQYLNPYKSDVVPYNKAADIVARLIDRTGDESLAPTAPDKKVSGKDKVTGNHVTQAIPAKRYEQLQQEIGQEIASKIIAMNNSLTDEQKAATITKIYEDVRKKYMDRVKRELNIVVR